MDNFSMEMPPFLERFYGPRRKPAYEPQPIDSGLQNVAPELSPPNMDVDGIYVQPGTQASWMKPAPISADVGRMPWDVAPEISPPNPNSDGINDVGFSPMTPTKPGVPMTGGPMPREPINDASMRPWFVRPKPNPNVPGVTPVASNPVNGPRMGGEYRNGPKRFASGGRVEMPDYLAGVGLGKVGLVDNGGTSTSTFSAPPSKMAPITTVAPGGGELNYSITPKMAPITTVTPGGDELNYSITPPVTPGVAQDGTPQEPQPIILPKLGRNRRSLTPSIRGYAPGGDTYGVAKLRTTRNIMPRFAEGGRIPSLSNHIQSAIAEGATEAPMFNMFHHDGPIMSEPDGVTDMQSDGLEPGGKVRGYADGGRVPAAKGTTLRQLAQQNQWDIDFDRLNQSGNDDGNAYRRQIFDMIGQQYNPYGSSGATFLDPMGRAGEVDVSIIPDNLRGTEWEAMARRLGAVDERGNLDAPMLRGMLARGRGSELFQGDRGMYNEYAADLGGMVYDDQLGWVPGEGGFQEGSRVGRSFDNMGMWGPGAVLGIGMLANTIGLGAMGAEGAGFASAPPGLEGAPSLTQGGTVATGGSAGATPGFAGNLAGASGTLTPGASLAGAGGAAGGGAGGFGEPMTPLQTNTATPLNTMSPDPMNQSWLSRVGSAITNNPLQSARIAATIAGGLGGGGGDDDYPDYQPTTGGPVGAGPSAPTETKPWGKYLSQFGGSSGARSGPTSVNLDVGDGYYSQAYRPLEDEVLKSARERMDPSYREGKALEAVADVSKAFEAQRGALTRDASRRGLKAPTQRDMIGMAASEGAARALAANKARRDMEESAIAQGAGLVQSGQRYLDRAAQAGAAASSGWGAAAAAETNAARDRETRAWQAMQQDRADANRRYEFDTNTGLERERINRNIYNQDRNYQQGQDDRDNQNRQRNLSGLGTIIAGGLDLWGKFNGKADGGRIIEGSAEHVADAEGGGRVSGPGTTTSDSIPARLSKGEAVLNADSVALIDKKSPGLIDRVNQLGLIKRAMKMGVSGTPVYNPRPGRTNYPSTIGVRG